MSRVPQKHLALPLASLDFGATPEEVAEEVAEEVLTDLNPDASVGVSATNFTSL